jgi:hypothetical protein
MLFIGTPFSDLYTAEDTKLFVFHLATMHGTKRHQETPRDTKRHCIRYMQHPQQQKMHGDCGIQRKRKG